MLVVLILLSLLYSIASCDNNLCYQTDMKPKLEECTVDILIKYFAVDNQLSYFNTKFEDDYLLDDIHPTEILSVQIGHPSRMKTGYNKAYMIVATNEKELFLLFAAISKEATWKPELKFLIVIDTIQEKEKVFDLLLEYHIIHVIVVNGTETAELFTYNPFDNYACGKYYVDITEFGRCSDVEIVDLYPDKLVTGLRNCTFNVSCPHWPPYSLNPNISGDHPYIMGTEQYIFHLISQIEQFKYNFNYDYDSETYSLVSKDMNVSGPLALIQRNLTDVLLGGLILTQTRAQLLFYIHGHLDQIDEIRVIVKSASKKPAWKNLYQEFSPLVWLLVLLAMMIYAVLLVMLLKVKDKGRVILIIFDHLMLHGTNIQVRKVVCIVLICWVWFAYLVNSYYQSSLVSLTMKPGLEFQVKDEQALNTYSLSACISEVMRRFMEGESNIATTYHNVTNDTSCAKHMTSIKTISYSKDRFTITPYAYYYYYKPELNDEYGNSPVYPFAKPFNKLIYAMYFYKGFPRKETLHKLALRIRETGLTDKSLRDLYYSKAVKFNFHSEPMTMRFAIPWHVYIIGVFASFLTFLLEFFKIKSK